MTKEIYTALITPFRNGQVDKKALGGIVEKLLKEGETHFVVGGTTGEASTLTLEEKDVILDTVLDETKGKAHIIMGISGNDTKLVKKQMNHFKDKPFDAYMIGTPYYNKPSKQGLYLHFDTLLKASTKPVILYNVPSRTGVSLTADLIIKLIEQHPHLVGLKQASDDFFMVDTIKARYPDFKIYIGDDHLLKKALDHQMDGMISVSSHIIYPKIKRFIDLYENGGYIELEDDFIVRFASFTFIESSPAPIKYMLYKLGYIDNELRLPLCTLSKENKEKIDAFFNYLFPIV